MLIRALEPLAGSSEMIGRRGRATDLCSGPGRVAQALGLDETLNGHSLSQEPLTLRVGAPVATGNVHVTGRVGVTRAASWPLRFVVRGSASTSRTRVARGTRSTPFVQALDAHRSAVDTLLAPALY